MRPLEPIPDLAAMEEACRERWEAADIHRFQPDGDGEVFSVDTPPPYVSAAHLHVGHAMSYSQAEFVVRYQRMRGRRIFYPMGFDDNGLPTERYVEKAHAIDRSKVSRSAFRALCLAETARGAAAYETLWRALGLSVDWSLRYSTIDEQCRRLAQRSFLELHARGRIYRSDDPVFWDPVMRTSLSQADLETVERKSRLHDVEFGGPDGRPLVISTTRPELLPSCVALYAHPDDDRHASLAGANATVPLFGHEVPIRTDREVDPSYGTGLLMVCTFGDSDDVRRWKRDSLPTRVCIGEDGRLDAGAGPYSGMRTEEARARVVADLETAGRLRDRRRITQRVAVAERSRAPVELIMRPHWFVRILDLGDRLKARSAELDWHPDWMRDRLDAWIDGLRQDWNISRQRFYGVPVPVWFCQACGEVHLARVEDLPVDPLEQRAPVDACVRCGGRDLAGDPDVMDTWMTSSVTPQILRGLGAEMPLTVRVQAFEIIRTWLFYTLVKAELHDDSLPWRDVMISGWGLNENGRKISKRDLDATNAPDTARRYDPGTVIAEHGADALRHWAAGSHLGRDLRYNSKDVKAGRKVVLKLWNLGRYLQSVEADAPAVADGGERRTVEDSWILARLDIAIDRATSAFDAYDYATAREAVDRFLWNELADDWVELVKDRFRRPELHSDQSRAAGRSTIRIALRGLLGLYAPMLPYVTDELWSRLFAASESAASLHVTDWPRRSGIEADADASSFVLAALRTCRAQRTDRRISQAAEVARLVIDESRLDVGTRRLCNLIEPSLLAASRARSVVFADALPEACAAGWHDLRVLIEPG